MAVEDDQTVWRTVFCKDPTLLHATTYPFADAEHTVVQTDPTKLLCTTTPDAAVSQPVHQGLAIQGIWPALDSVRINKAEPVSGIAVAIIYTVPANNKLFISSGILASLSDGVAPGVARMGVRNGVDVLQYWLMYHYYRIEGQQVSSLGYVPALEAEAGWDVFVEGRAAGTSARGFFFGWLEVV